MNILFLHKTFPTQFKHISAELAKDPANRVVFISDNRYDEKVEGVERIMYPYIAPIPAENCHRCMKNYIEATLSAQSAASLALTLKKQGFIPDIVIGFSGWGDSMFMKDVFPETPFLSYYEWYYDADSEDVRFGNIKLTEEDREMIRCLNAKFLIDLYSSDAGISPTEWQKKQFPIEYQDKIKVIHDGIDTEYFKPNKDAKFLLKDKNLELTSKDEVITYGTRGMEPYRGFPQFMEAVEVLLKKRPNAHFLIAGEDIICYGQQLQGVSYKQRALDTLNLDMGRVHFVGKLSYDEYLSMLQISSAHIYLTYPYVLSWSFLEAMAAGCCVVASNTTPVLEFMKNNYNGLLAEFYDIEHIVKRVVYALDNQDEVKSIRENARKTVIEKCELKDMLKKQMDYINSLIKK